MSVPRESGDLNILYLIHTMVFSLTPGSQHYLTTQRQPVLIVPIANLEFANTRPEIALLGNVKPHGTRGVNAVVRERVSNPVHLDASILKSKENKHPADRDRSRERGRRHVVVLGPPWQEPIPVTMKEPVGDSSNEGKEEQENSPTLKVDVEDEPNRHRRPNIRQVIGRRGETADKEDKHMELAHSGTLESNVEDDRKHWNVEDKPFNRKKMFGPSVPHNTDEVNNWLISRAGKLVLLRRVTHVFDAGHLKIEHPNTHERRRCARTPSGTHAQK